MDYTQLASKASAVRQALRQAQTPLRPGQGLTTALDDAEAIAAGRQNPARPFGEYATAAGVVWALADTLAACQAHGLNVGSTVRKMTTGTTNYGTPDQSGRNRDIYYKDFEFELFLAGRCAVAGLPVRLPAADNDPIADAEVPPVVLQAKHPDSAEQLQRYVSKFNRRLRDAGRYGVFAAGLEDAFDLDPGHVFNSRPEWQAWLGERAEAVEQFGRTFLRAAAHADRVLATVQTWTVWMRVGGTSRLERFGNAVCFDDRSGVPADAADAARSVATVFNPNPRPWSQIRIGVLTPTTEPERAAVRRSLHTRAYCLWETEGRPDGRALDHWLRAKDEYGLRGVPGV